MLTDKEIYELGIKQYAENCRKSFIEQKMKEWDENHLTNTTTHIDNSNPFDLSQYKHYKGNNKNDYQNRPSKKTYVFTADGKTLLKECDSRGIAARFVDIEQTNIYYYLNREKIYTSDRGKFIIRDHL